MIGYSKPEYLWEVSGAVTEEDETVKIYWGGADSVVCADSHSINDLVGLSLTMLSPV